MLSSSRNIPKHIQSGCVMPCWTIWTPCLPTPLPLWELGCGLIYHLYVPWSPSGSLGPRASASLSTSLETLGKFQTKPWQGSYRYQGVWMGVLMRSSRTWLECLHTSSPSVRLLLGGQSHTPSLPQWILGSLQHSSVDACEHELGLLPVNGNQ